MTSEKSERYMDGKMVPVEPGDDGVNPSGIGSTVPAEEMEEEEGVHKREQWTRKIDFLLACIGFSVGLGNVWRFPYLCYKNGGGAFLIPYFTCVLIGGIPLFYIEVALGQFMTKGGIGAWMICPLFQGVGFASIVVVFLVDCYYNVILAWGFYYLFASFTLELPWAKCGHTWNTETCKDENTNLTAYPEGFNFTDPVTEYWERKALGISSGIDNMGTVKWDLCLCLLFSWIVVYLCICKGIKSSGKVMYVTATSPYLLMLILLVRGCTLDGAIDGIKFYLIPQWEKLLEAQVWVDAGTQIFFSYSIALGTLTALGSFNKFNHNCYRDSIIFACANSGTSFFAGFVIFSVLGFMAKQAGTTVDQVAESGPGLAFIAYPQAVAAMPFAPPLWSILFFIMLILLGLDSQFVGVEGFVTAAVDMYPTFLRKGYRKEIFIGIVCSTCFFVGIPMVMNGGMYVFQIFDYYAGSRIIVLIAFFECFVIAWVYGVRRFYDNMAMMLGRQIDPYMKISWTITSPIFCLVIFALIMYTYSDLTYNRTYYYPGWAIAVGWVMACSSIVMIPIVMVIRILMAKGSLRERIRYLLTPQLAPHQLRPQDPITDLAPQYRDKYAASRANNAAYTNPTFTTEGSIVDNTKL